MYGRILLNQKRIERAKEFFQVCRSFPIPSHLESSISTSVPPEISIELEVNKGVVQHVNVKQPLFGLSEVDLPSALIGIEFGPGLPSAVEARLPESLEARFMARCVREMVEEFV